MIYRKKYTILILVAIVLAAAFSYWRIQKPESFEIIGNVKKIEDSRILVEGQYVIKKDSQPGQLSPIQFEVSVSDKTVITRSAFIVPPKEELAKTGGRFEPQKLPRQESRVSLNDLRQDVNGRYGVSLTAQSSNDIYGRTEFEAVNIIYNVPIFQ
ncbi:MAG: hypothetical protein AAB627_02030 [Patescibacteria group bacterium]